MVLCVVHLHADDTKTAKGMLDFMLAWYERFPQFKSNKLFLAGQSYAGARIFFKYINSFFSFKKSKPFIEIMKKSIAFLNNNWFVCVATDHSDTLQTPYVRVPL